MDNTGNISKRSQDLFIYLISGFILGACVLFYAGTIISRNITNQTVYGLFWVIYIITIITLGNTVFNYYTYTNISTKEGITGSVGEPGTDGDKGDDGDCDRDCTLKSYSLVGINRLNKEYNKIIFKYTGKEPYPEKAINNNYIKDMIKRIIDSAQFKEISQIKHPNVVLDYLVEHFVKWFEIIVNADKSEGKKHFQDYMDVYGEQVEWETIIKDDDNPFHEIEKYDVFYWGLDKEFHPIRLQSCLKVPKPEVEKKPTGPIKVIRTNVYQEDYNDKKSGSDRDVSTWISRPVTIKGHTFNSLGSVGIPYYDSQGGGRFIEQVGPENSNIIDMNGNTFKGPYKTNIMVSADSKWVRKPHPDHWSWKWDTKRKNNTKNRFRKSDYMRGTWWNAEDFYEDGELYRCQGSMITPTQRDWSTNPSKYFGRENVPFYCINDKALEKIPHKHKNIWDDAGFGATDDGSIFSNNDGEYNLIYFRDGYNVDYGRKAYKIKREMIDTTPLIDTTKHFTNNEEIDLGFGVGFQDVKYDKERKHGMFDLLDLIVKSPLQSLYTNQKIFVEHTGLNRPNSYFVKVIDKQTNAPSSCLKISNSKINLVDCNPLEGQSKEVCLLKSTETEKYLFTKGTDNYSVTGNLPERNINNTQLKPFLWRVLENK